MLRCSGFSLQCLLLVWSTGSAVVAHGLSCRKACGIFPDEGSNPCSLRWQADSYPLHHQGSPQNADVNIPYDKLPRQVVDTREIKKSLWILILPQQEPAPPPALGPAELGTLPRPSPFCSFAMEAIYFLGLSRPILHPQSHSPLKTGGGCS